MISKATQKKRLHQNKIIIISILLVLGGVISIYLYQFSEIWCDLCIDPPSVEYIAHTCNSTCNILSQQEVDSAEYLDTVWEYCYTWVGEAAGDYPTQLRKMDDGNYFCKDGVHCFNLLENYCEVEGQIITPEYCKDIACRILKNSGKTEKESERIIKNRINEGSCSLTKGHTLWAGLKKKKITEETWWELYFENPDCSAVFNSS